MNIDQQFKAKLNVGIGPLTFAHVMKVARNSLGLTQADFGKKFGLSKANICDIEKGRHVVSTTYALKIARKIGFPEKLALQACFQDQLQKADLEGKVVVS